jgi:hypothetical protein
MIYRIAFYQSFGKKLKIKGRRHDYLAQLYFTHSTKNSFGTPNKCQIRRNLSRSITGSIHR